ncbi:DUF3592 domain-containing protein [Chitinispirillales bacterium ANBcel5]|uniref:DUF3592 domain-containing protein n=1 Tax=Cellulosispirillum alkaliphilum TaxID=3039283 RepID=UPI002A50BD91|nr:DUF3592 domain-containing protein [Chitinispirillales bacterium ANBcel5]
MKSFKVTGAIFFLIGVGSMIGLVVSVSMTKSFIRDASTTQGQIVDVTTRTSRDSDGYTRTTRYPVVQFKDNTGTTIQFESSSSVGTIRMGDMVEVSYIPDKPNSARITDSFMHLWGVSIFLAIFAISFTGFGIISYWFGIRDDLREKRAVTYSKEIMAKIKGIEYNTSIRMNGRSPFVIKAQWLNPDTNEIHVFKSKNFWYDPSEYLKEEILVKADPRNLKKYWMDVSSFPKKA